MSDLNDLTQNVNIWNDEKSKSVTVSTDGAKERLDCNIDGSQVEITSDESLTKFTLRTDYDATGVALNTSTDTSLFSFVGAGVIDLMAVNSTTSSAWEITIKIDGTERLRISMSDLGTALGLTDSAFDLSALTANKQFRYHPAQIGFQTSFEILAKAVTATPTVRHLVMYREKVA